MNIEVTETVPLPKYRLPKMRNNGLVRVKAASSGPGKAGRPRLYPLDKMKVGSSFVVPAKKALSVRTCVFVYRAQHKPKFRVVIRKEGRNVRVFCVSR